MDFTTLFFDLDDTLYPPSTGLWKAIRERIELYMRQELRLPDHEIPRLRQFFLETYGTTLRGLQATYSVNTDDFLTFVHDLPLENYLKPDPGLYAVLTSLPVKPWIFTNADHAHARRVLETLNLSDCFLGIIDIRALNFVSKPNEGAYRQAMKISGITDPKQCVFFDDALRNLIPARALGFFTVLVGTPSPSPMVDLTLPSLHTLRESFPSLWQSSKGFSSLHV